MADAPKPPNERDLMLHWLQTHSAFGRLTLSELGAAFDRAEQEGGIVLTKIQADPANG